LANIINGTDTGSGGLITTGDSSDELQLQTAEVARVTLTNTAVVVNESGANVDFRVEGDTEANLLFVDASADNVGIGTSSPSRQLEVSKAGIAYIRAADTINSVNMEMLAASSGGWVGTQTNHALLFQANNTEKARITTDGYLRLAGGGIQFNGDTAAANALNDYEAGTWTPTDASGAGLTLSVAGTPRYVKIGRFVFFNVGLITYPSTANGSGASVGGLPFTVDSNNHGTLSFVATTANASAGLSVANTTEIFFYANGTTSRSTNANLSGAQIYGISGCYQVP
jgi:hypothetical protein